MNKFFQTQEDEEDRKRVSHSQMKQWRTCKKKWALKYRDGHRPPDESIHLVFGTALHEALQEYLQKMYRGTVQEANKLDLKSNFTSLLKEEFDKRKEAFNEDYPDEEFPVTKEEMVEFAKDGKAIIEHFRRNRSKYFKKQETELVGIEEKIEREVANGVDWIGYLDVVLRDRKTGKYKIIDLKTSTDGWDKWDKREKKKTDQLVAYKKFYAEQLDIDPDMIEIEYLILKRKCGKYDSRFQQFSPSDGTKSLNRVSDKINEFVSDCFDEDGNYRDKEFDAEPDRYQCAFCPFSEQHGEKGFRICAQGGKKFLDYGENMAPYVDDKYVGPQPEQR